jgi:exodeoxyribonuclease V beta subunit
VYTLPPERLPNPKRRAPLSDPERAPLDAMIETLLAGDAAAFAHLDWREGWPAQDAQLPPAEAAAGERQALPLPPPAPMRQRLSFSALVGGARPALEEAAADDEATPAAPEPVLSTEPPHPELLALAGARGTAFGNALHLAFEQRDPTRPLTDQFALVLAQLEENGVRSEPPLPVLAPLLARRLDGALAAELWPGLALGKVPPQAQRAEMAFHFALDQARASALRAACAAHGEAGLVPPLAFDRLRGLMTGKIDLVFEHAGRFHVLDYKGNWLGERLADYTGDALRAAMDHSHYRLQALLYTVAVHRLLRQRIPGYSTEKHLGGYAYLFVRAAGLAPGAGVFAERFPDALVQAVDAVFAAREEGA